MKNECVTGHNFSAERAVHPAVRRAVRPVVHSAAHPAVALYNRIMIYTTCPKCGRTPLPEQQTFPAACPACGLVLSKFKTETQRQDWETERLLTVSDVAAADSIIGRAAAILFHVPLQVARFNWQGRILALVIFSLWSIWIFKDFSITEGHPGSRLLHMVLLPFHEAGHYAIFRWFGEFVMILGGTLGQHLMPLVLCGALLIKRRDPFGAALFFWLLGFSVADMGIYMYDAFDPKLMLLGGGTGAESDGHDWQNIFGDLNLLRRAQAIGRISAWIGAQMMLVGLVWAAWMVWLQRRWLTDGMFAEEDKYE